MITRKQSLPRRTRRETTGGADGVAAATLAGLQPRRSLSPAQELQALQRFNQLGRYKALVAGGLSQSQAAQRCGLGRTSAWRWLKRLESGGLAALAPQTDRRGRRSLADGIGLTPPLVKLLRTICIGVGNIQTGFKLFAQLPQCPPRLARVVSQAKSIPMSLRRLVAAQPVKLSGLRAGNQIVLIQTGGCA